MKQQKYNQIKSAIVKYLKKRQCFCFRKSIIKDLGVMGFKKTNVIYTLRRMRKEKEIKMAYRRWGI